VTWVLVIVGFSALIILHEFGHFAVAKWTGMRVERFFLFFPPKLVSIKRGETEYGIGMIPLGGFVKITGMNPEELEEAEEAAQSPGDSPAATPGTAAAMEAGRDTPEGLLERVESFGQSSSEPLPPDVLARAYYNQPVWKRVVVIAAGPAMNILIAFLILFGLAFALDKAVGSGIEVHDLTSGSASAGALQPGDRILAVDGVSASNLSLDDRMDRFRKAVGSHKCAGQPTQGCPATTPVTITVERNGRQVPVSVTPKYDEGAQQNLLGIQFGAADTEPVANAVPQAADYAVDTMWLIGSKTVSALARIVEPEQRKQLSGPVGSSRALNEAIGFGLKDALLILAVISLSLGIINLFPFLPLDGGHIFWSLVEKFRGERVPFSIIERASAVGFLLIFLLFVVGLTNDLGRLGQDALNPK
jgi:regulator of sigma E protease